MNEALIANWNANVRPDDIVWHLGDFAFASIDKIEHILSRLNGRKHLVFGNHDKVLRNDKRVLNTYFERAVEKAFIKVPCADANRGVQDIVLNHFPELTWDKKHYGSFMLHGHCHGTMKYPFKAKILDVGVDPCNHSPISFDSIYAMLSRVVDDQSSDHH
jgi:calcineurin-like phosphoesterase family protein